MERVLEVEDADAQRDLLMTVIREGEAVTLRYRHSLYGGLVWEVLRVRGDRLVLEEVEAEREAALEYYQFAGKVVRMDGRFRVTGLDLAVRELYVRATQLGGRTLIVRGRELSLPGEGREGHLIRIRLSKRSLLWFLVRLLTQNPCHSLQERDPGGSVRCETWEVGAF
jgi:hypothetical protein